MEKVKTESYWTRARHVKFDIDFDICDNNTYYNVVNDSNAETIKEVNDIEHSLIEQLSSWAVLFDIKSIALTALLKLLNNYHNELPLDARTLLHTPRNSSVVALRSSDRPKFGSVPVPAEISV